MPRWLKVLVTAAWLVAALGFVTRTLLPAAQTITYGFMGYYTAAWLLARGEWTPDAYDDDHFRARVEALTDGQLGDIIGYNPPAVALILFPLAGLSLREARWVWTLANAGLLALAGWLIFRAVARTRPVSRWLWLALSALALADAPLIENIRFGQVYVLLLCLYAATLWGWATERDEVTGLGLGLMGLLKASGLPLWLLLVTRRWPRPPWRILAMGAALALLTLSCLGPAIYVAFLRRVPEELMSTPWVTLTVFQSTPSFFAHFLRFESQFNPAPIANWPGVANGLTLTVTAVSLGLTLWRMRQADLTLAFAAATVLAVVLFPVAEQYHSTLLLLPLSVLAADLVASGARWRWIAGWAVAAALLALPLSYQTPRLSQGWLSLLAYPRLYGGWLLWALLMLRSKSAPPEA